MLSKSEKINRCNAVHKSTRTNVTLVYHLLVIGAQTKCFLKDHDAQKPIFSLTCCISKCSSVTVAAFVLLF